MIRSNLSLMSGGGMTTTAPQTQAFQRPKVHKAPNCNKRAQNVQVHANKPSSASISATATQTKVEEDSINSIRFLAIDAIEKANSGHPGLPMGCAPIGYKLFTDVMNHNPANTNWFNRDRFVLSAGHGCMLQYALMYLAGYPGVTQDDMRQFRQWGSQCPGHPENFITEGIEVTTGPLGQGMAMAVGLAAAEKHLAARYNRPGCEVVDHYTYVVVGDGCNMEGVTNEAGSLAGHWGLGKLIVLYDDNSISIDGHTDISFTEDVSKRFEALGWHCQHVQDGNTDTESIAAAIAAAKSETSRPSFIKVTTLIGYGSPNKVNTHAVHGAALGTDEVAATRENLGWEHEPFEVPTDVRQHMDVREKGEALEKKWEAEMAKLHTEHPEVHAEFKQLISGELPGNWEEALPPFTPDDKGVATRIHSQTMLNALEPVLPGLVGGSADLAPSNMTLMKNTGDFQRDTPEGRNFRFGVREHAMGSIANGIGLHKSGLLAYVATFFVFTDYMRAAIRMAAIQQIGTIHIMTHDSIGLGEDGPTHQPIEHLASLRAMPNLLVLRPCDGNETAGAYEVAVKNRTRPSVLALSRQALPNLPGSNKNMVSKGAYTIQDCEGTPDVLLLSTGSEVEIACNAADELGSKGIKARVISMVCWELFDEQPSDYKTATIPGDVPKVSVEAGSTFGWERYADSSVGIDTFGASAPASVLYEKFNITVDNVINHVNSVMGK